MTHKILITGGAGYIGSHTVLAALEQGYEVAVIDNLSTGLRSAVPSDLRFYQEDVADKSKVSKILRDYRPDAVIHFAGSIIVQESVENPLKYYKNNTAASLNLIDCCIGEKISNFIFSSTAAVYGIAEKEKVAETDPLSPINPYGHSKLMTEQLLADCAAAYDFNYTALRYFNVAGADKELRAGQSTPNTTHLIKVACQCALNPDRLMQVFGTDYATPDGTCIRDYIHVSDLAHAHIKALEYMFKHKVSSTFNCGNGRGYSVKEILDSVQRVSGVKLNIQYTDRRAGDPPALIANSQALQKQTDWTAQITQIDDIVRTAFEWERKKI